jgi:hypothetical protein
MAKRLTREMADDAADKLAALAFDKKIEKIKSEMTKFGDVLINKYIPAPILALGDEYAQYFPDRNNHIQFTSETAPSYHYSALPCTVSNPIYRKVFVLSEEDYKKGHGLKRRYDDLCGDKRRYKSDVSDALMQLKSEKRIQEQFPEALPYLNFCETTALVPQFVELRAMLK